MSLLNDLREAYPQIDWSTFSDWRGEHFLGPVGDGLALMIIPSFEYRHGFQALLKEPCEGAFVKNKGTRARGLEGGMSPVAAVRRFIQEMNLRVWSGQQASIILKDFPETKQE